MEPRSERCFAVLRAALANASVASNLRATAASIQGNHVHAMAEPSSAEALSQGIRQFKTEAARGLNRLMGRSGPVFEEGRFHQHVLETPREVLRALEYIRWNTWKHRREMGRPLPRNVVDPYTFGFFGDETLLPDPCQGLVVEPRGWLLSQGWRLGIATSAAAPPWAPARPARRPAGGTVTTLPLFALASPAVAEECAGAGLLL